VRIAVISDIHGNLHALAAVLTAIEGEAPDAFWCLGDLVGYGPRPNACTREVAARAEICLAGNHDLGVLGRLDLLEFSPEAAVAARWSAAVLEREERAYLEGLRPAARHDEVGLYHASPRDPIWEYVLTPDAALLAFRACDDALVLVGHSHVPLAISLEDDELDGGHMPGATSVELDPKRRWLLNPGSVGQPRDVDPRAAFLLLDLGARRADFHRVAYPIRTTQAEIRERGLPEILAARLELGV
jgi:diadenosine tetraphosphatase ApaH/serine/threonine PP2A family protein phosphatase